VSTSLHAASPPPGGAAPNSDLTPRAAVMQPGASPSGGALGRGGIVRIFELATAAGAPACVGYVVADDVLDVRLGRGLHLVLEALRGGPR
jgi:hypothetical protein